MERFDEILIDGSAHPAAAFQDPSKKWRAHREYVRDHRKHFQRVLEQGHEKLRQVLTERELLERTESPSAEAQRKLIYEFDLCHGGLDSVDYWRGAVQFSFIGSDEAIGFALAAMDDIAQAILERGGRISFTRQRARRWRLEAAEAAQEREDKEFHEWFHKEKAAMKKACPDYEQLAPRYTVISSISDVAKIDLDELIAGITPDNINVDREWLDAPAVGREFPNEE
jgi:hypothetical protein